MEHPPHYQISSQLGNRDSEIATVIEDTDLVPSRMNGVPVSMLHGNLFQATQWYFTCSIMHQDLH